MQRGRPRPIAVKKWIRPVMIGLIMVMAIPSFSRAEEQIPGPEQSPPVSTMSQGQCSELVALLAEQEEKNSREFRQLKRDLAALSQQVTEPGMREIMGGIGYIFGLFGVAAYVASRKKADRGET